MMKNIIAIIICMLLSGYPMKVGFTQTATPEEKTQQGVNNKKEADLKTKIAANIDTALTNIVHSKNVIIQMKQEPPKKKVSSHTKYRTITDTVYVDTCYLKEPQLIISQMPTVIEKPQPIIPKKQKFFQRLFGHKKRN